MAARKNKPLHDDRTKERIRASQLLNRLNLHANGEVEMTPSQVQAAKIVIGKIVPDLKAVELSGGTDNTHRLEVVAPWLKPTVQARNS